VLARRRRRFFAAEAENWNTSRVISVFNLDRLIRFRADGQQFSGDNFDHLFSERKVEGLAASIRQISSEAEQISALTRSLTRHIFLFDYNRFGNVHHAG
jgi:hypothetical protein